MKILLAAHAVDLTGAERDLIEAVDALRARGANEVEVVVPAQGPLLDALHERGVPATVVPYRWWMSQRALVPRAAAFLASYPGAASRAAAFIDRTQPDVVVTFTLTVPVWAAAARRRGVPHVWMAREFGVEDHGLHFLLGRRRSMRFVDHSSAIVGVPSHAVATRLSEWIARDKLRVIHSGQGPSPAGAVARAADGTCRGDGFELLVVGTLRHSKGQHEAIAAVARVRAEGVPAELTVVGPGRSGYRRRLERLANKAGVGDAVTFTGSVPDTTPYYDAADVLLLPSRAEAYGRVVIEAMRRGLAVIGSNAGGTVEQIEDSGGGLLYERGDVDDLAAAIKRLHDDPALRQRLGAAGRAWATSTLTLERLGDELMAVVEDAVRARPPEETS